MLHVTVKSFADNGFRGVIGDIGDLAESLALINLEMWTSTAGIETALRASRIATEVWVYAPGLMTIPSTLSKYACWM